MCGVRVGLYFAGYFEAGTVRQPDVADDEVVAVFGERTQPRSARCGAVASEAGVDQQTLKDVAIVCLVVDDEDVGARGV